MDFTNIDGLVIVIWNVEFGNAVYIKTPNNKHIVIDLGVGNCSNDGTQMFSPLLYLKENCRIDTLDLLIVTNPQKEYLLDILNTDEIKPKEVIFLNQDNNSRKINGSDDIRIFNKYAELCSEFAGAIVYEDSMTNPNNTDHVDIEVFVPYEFSEVDFQDKSLATLIRYKDFRMVIPGNNTSEALDELLCSNSMLRIFSVHADILLMSNHKGKSAIPEKFVKHVVPKLTIVSDGKNADDVLNNKYMQLCSGLLDLNMKTDRWEVTKLLTTNHDKEIMIVVDSARYGNYKPKVISGFLS